MYAVYACNLLQLQYEIGEDHHDSKDRAIWIRCVENNFYCAYVRSRIGEFHS